MSEYSEESSFDAFLPLTLLSLALCLILGWQIFNAIQTRSAMTNQFQQRKQLVDQSAKVQSGLEAMINDLLTLADNDKDAKAIVDKYQIRRNAPTK
ncbi:MAG: hypothetical protein SFU85_01770 [Candidatus Methylacidiphilales bacterium]|nr:hypothetical protein [Candidatus Methylacidiphilales bacterium]